ncbi:MAG: branched-chain amino acid ABC transporter substrate-binding protein [Candidatus Hydrogenedentes bacterium]|nr:branched-chain amino acid ABC transporter substrate-binding protein [Candidatus Hydrogenedentota bacterium]
MIGLTSRCVCMIAACLLGALGVAYAQDPNTIKIVSSLPQTGSANAQTSTMVNGIRMAIDEVGGKAGPFTVRYEPWDDASPERGQWDPAVEAANADRAIADPDVMAYIGTYNSGAAKIAMPKLNQAGVLMVSPANTWPGLTKPGIGEANEPMTYRPSGNITYFRVVPADDIQGLVAAKWAAEMNCKKVFILHDRELYGKGVATMFQKSAPALGLEITGFEGIEPKASNYKSLVTKIRQKNPDLVYFGGTTQTNAGQIAKDLRSAGLNVKYMVPDGCYEKAFIQAAGAENVEGSAFITFGGVPPDRLTGKGKEFYENYKKKYNSEPEGYAAYGYEAAKVVLDSIARAGKKDRGAIVAAAAATKDFEGALGKWSFDANGDTTLKTMSGNTVKNGEYAFVKVLGE